ncbi:uncharacterized protein LTR77_003584 [Saxophila tyrrhenica]|uniref:DUF7704 domain-containing protein n=1 Tax=Saxophila tyrrhenica TaxID=1690608 RepID=A0AAV9PI95_9PEZI|nr:hypothetical protein LTR77_003584 [Saxophila tyrrhenica]
MASTDFSNIPSFYRFYFRWSDPAICLWGAYMDFITPAFVLNAFVPSTIAPHNPLFDFTLQQLGGALLMLAFIDVVLLRYTNDIKVWKILQAAVLIYDLSLLYSNLDALGQQVRLSWGKLRWEDVGGIAITAQAVVVRTAFLLGVGLAEGGKKGKRS